MATREPSSAAANGGSPYVVATINGVSTSESNRGPPGHDATASAQRGAGQQHAPSSTSTRGKRSAVFVHTTFLRFVTDAKGKQYSERQCNYCASAFSFKNGTTSQALRHLKATHSECLLGAGGSGKNTAVATAPLATSSSDPQPNGEPTTTTSTHALMNNSNDPLQSHAAATVASPVRSSIDPVPSTVNNDSNTTYSTNQAATTSTTVQPPQLHWYDALQDQLAAPAKRKRLSTNEPSTNGAPPTTATGVVAHPATPLPPASTVTAAVEPELPLSLVLPPVPPLPLTQSQVAVAHFLQYFRHLLPVARRLQFVRHLTHDTREAELYNVLDAATQREFIREFAINTNDSSDTAERTND